MDAALADEASKEADDAKVAKGSSRWRWFTIAGVALLVVGGIIAALGVSFHYAHAKPLQLAGSAEWGGTDLRNSHEVEAGPWTSMNTPARPGHAQSFYVMLMNESSVSQTIVGLTDPGKQTAEPEDLAVALPERSTLDDQQDAPEHKYTAEPQTIPPGGIRWVRVTTHTATGNAWAPGRQEIWTDLYLRVRVGAFTRNEVISLDDLAFTLVGTKRYLG